MALYYRSVSIHGNVARTPRIPTDCRLRLPHLNADSDDGNPKTFAQQKMTESQELHDQCAKSMMKRHLQNKRLYGEKTRRSQYYTMGDRVLVRKQTPTSKIEDNYQSEIHEVMSQKSEVVYLVRGLETALIKCYHHAHRDCCH